MGLGIGDVYCILLYMICFGDELGIWVEWIYWGWCAEMLVYVGCVEMFGEVRCASLA